MESQLVAWLRQRLPPHRCLRLGIGDDAAVLEWGSSPSCVVTVDVISDEVDFHLGEVDARRVGHKALGVSLSDLAAMAARPLGVVIAACLPRRSGQQLAIELFEGMLPLAERHDVALAGGDTHSWEGPLAISVTAIGELTPHGPLVRHGACPGDQIVVTGSFGGSLLGKHLDFEPRVREALLLNDRYTLHAGMDVSDGLAIDLGRLAEASGCGAVVHTDTVPVAEAAAEMARRPDDGRTPLDHALSDGEDFELLLAVPAESAERMLADQPLDGVRLTSIGKFVDETGLWQVADGGPRQALEPRGYEHRFE